MNDIEVKSPLASERLAWGITVLAIALLLDLFLSGYGLANLNVEIDPTQATQVNPLQIALGCITPLSGVLKLVGVILVFVDSSRLGGTHRKLALTGLILYLLSIITTIAVIFLSLGATLQGSLVSYFLTVWMSAVGGLLSFTALVLTVAMICPQWIRLVMIAAIVLTAVGTIGITFVSNSHTTMSSYEMMGNTYYIPKVDLDKTHGIYPTLAVVGSLGSLLLFVAYTALMIQTWRVTSNQVPESVS